MVQKSPKLFRKFGKLPESSIRFRKAPNSFGLFPINRNQYQNALLKRS